MYLRRLYDLPVLSVVDTLSITSRPHQRPSYYDRDDRGYDKI
ncbi:hypothetical protein YPC_1036 [Yersinia pestis biovar Medievalis str. Harbin 35]|nr:hypothetical protein YPC_1036 [Yersinia pestis biovar Medievalis str. Harbin 35]EEO75471.1 hypothetical protein YP516_3391 [Yersinia pestis Nepal516]EEO82288.1 hypothetical protein YPF_1099 [Yersinia pestis biovar Orientalis str. India 195]EEO87104.1 hypothetical protein YPH_3037 [Yersinia pestis biovar Orientalis str. PEXU2]EEO91104.1 hypothetical protein YPS_1643 [Yersinia pestis Pestoides A]EKS47378.1 hypothetical protein INS_04051 [Yersinia pestis INS]